ncbi:MAG TPA: hypothetical protein VNA16_07425, partial [Abditibacteriaceae bacterium]|nr:hypothetical protein [Abditibacteriaceae bacterium]
LKMIGVKNVRHLPPDAARKQWESAWCALDEGLVDWPAAMKAMRAAGYPGPLSVHATYSAFRDKEGALRLVEKDLAYLRPFVS